jgi:hypothetical protein
MIVHVFCIRDRATDQYSNPMFLLSNGHAIRTFTDEVNRKSDDNLIYHHPDDYDLYRLGEFNTDSGMFDTGVPEMVCVGKNVSVKE